MQDHRLSSQQKNRNSAVGIFSILLLYFFLSTSVIAHEIRPAIIDFSFDKHGLYQLTIQHNIEALLAEIESTHDDTEKSYNANKYNDLRNLSPTKLKLEFDNFSESFLSNIKLSFDGTKVPLNILDVEIPEVGDTELARDSLITIAGVIPENTKQVSWQWDKKFGNAVFRIINTATK